MKLNLFVYLTIMVLLLSLACSDDNTENTYPDVSREEKLPQDIEKHTPETDDFPPILHSDEFEAPIPLPGYVNTSGAEDSPFITPDGRTLYFFFTPDVRIPPEKQLLDEVTGVWVYTGDTVQGMRKPVRQWLQDPGKLALDGAVAIQNDEMWFASVREGYTGVNMFTAEYINGKWTNWKYSGDRLMHEIQVGECHIHGDTLYFHSGRPGTKGDFDIWITVRSSGKWSDPENIVAVNTNSMDGFPFVSSDGSELWFTRQYKGTPGVFRSKKSNGIWQTPELILERFAGEPTLDDDGNLYFVHHFYKNNKMIEADIYICYKK